MQLPNTRGQQQRDNLYDASGTITTGGTAQLLLPEAKSRSLLILQNISDTAMFVEFGSARATATLTSGVVTSCSITNAGFGFTIPPIIEFLGGGNDGWNMGNPTMNTPGLPGWPSPANPALGIAVLSGTTVGSITVTNGGANYKNAPYVFIRNSYNDPFGCATPSATSGIQLPANMTVPFIFNGTACPTDSVAIFCATTEKSFACKYMA